MASADRKGSVQLRQYLSLREFGHARADAAAFTGIGIGEAELIDRDKGFDPAASETRT